MLTSPTSKAGSIVALLLAAWACTAQAQAPEPSKAPRIGNPDWLYKPSGDDIARVFPSRALRLGHAGAAMIRCTVTAAGTLSDCVILQEAPEAMGFGEAALKLRSRFKMRAAPGDTRPLEGASVMIPIRFTLGGARGPALDPNLRARSCPPMADCPAAWASKPSGQAVAPDFPRALMTSGLSGAAVLRCTAAVDGKAADCSLLAEGPDRKGVGRAALRMSRLFRLAPKRVAGRAFESSVVIPVEFVLGEAAVPQLRIKPDPAAKILDPLIVTGTRLP